MSNSLFSKQNQNALQPPLFREMDHHLSLFHPLDLLDVLLNSPHGPDGSKLPQILARVEANPRQLPPPTRKQKFSFYLFRQPVLVRADFLRSRVHVFEHASWELLRVD